MNGSKLSLADVQDLGGTKDDLKLLDGVDEDNASEIDFGGTGESGDGDDGSEHRKEIEAFAKSIGLYQNQIQTEGKTKPATREGEAEKKKKKKKRDRESVLGATRGEEVSHPPPEPGRLLMKLRMKEYKKMLVPLDNEKRWFEKSNSTTSSTHQHVNAAVLNHLTKIAEDLMQTEVMLYEKVRLKHKGPGDIRWLKTVLSSGVLSDKVAALILLIQESPIHTLPSLDTLLGMASKKGKRECLIATDTLREIWLSDLLPEDRKLKSMKTRPLTELVEEPSDRVCHTKLLLWYYEDQLKARFAKYLSIVKVLSHDPVANIREKMLGAIFDLLYRKPEQERELLSQLVNKLGDPVKKVASKAVLFLLKLLNHHVNMKTIVAKEMKCLLHRPNISSRAQYYAICTLNQFTMEQEDQELAKSLVDVYFTFFKVYSMKKELDAKMLAALLTGVNRAFPFTKGDIPNFEDHLQSLFRVVHTGPLATGIQSLMLLYQVMESHQAVSGRYYQALYSKLLDPRLKHSGKQAIFLNLLFKSLKGDPETNRVKAFLKRILQVCGVHNPPFVCGCLYLMSEILKLRSNLWAFILQPESTDEEHFVDVPETREKDSDDIVTKKNSGSVYKIDSRNPLYSGAESSSLWELAKFKMHYHPSVQAFAMKIAAGEHVQYHGDPLLDFTLMRFLDRFVRKNPKQKMSDHGGSLMQRASKLVRSHMKEDTGNSSQFPGLDMTGEVGVGVGRASNKMEDDEEEDDISGSNGDIELGEVEDIDEAYDNLPSDEDSFLGAGSEDDDDGDASEAKLEKLLLANMSSSDEEEERGVSDSVQKPLKKKRKMKEDSKMDKGFDPNVMFAAAEEFAHLLEESDSAKGGGGGGGGGGERKYKKRRKTLSHHKNGSKNSNTQRTGGGRHHRGRKRA